MIEFKQIQDFFVVLMAILGFVAIIGELVNIFIKWNKESNGKKHSEMLRDHEHRINKLENKTKEQDEFIHIQCQALLALISHELNGNSKEKLQKAKDELEKFLINK